jgi:hypothetical protein
MAYPVSISRDSCAIVLRQILMPSGPYLGLATPLSQCPENKEKTCQFHLRMSLERHTNQLIRRDLQAKHMRLCQDYRKC